MDLSLVDMHPSSWTADRANGRPDAKIVHFKGRVLLLLFVCTLETTLCITFVGRIRNTFKSKDIVMNHFIDCIKLHMHTSRSPVRQHELAFATSNIFHFDYHPAI